MLYRRSFWMSPFAFAWWIIRVFFSGYVILFLFMMGLVIFVMNGEKIGCVLDPKGKPSPAYAVRGPDGIYRHPTCDQVKWWPN